MPDIYMFPVRLYLLDSLTTTSIDVNPARNKKDFVIRQKGILCSKMLHLFFGCHLGPTIHLLALKGAHLLLAMV